jgi:ubiquinone/menaquinone biosynthesis C-methylase UbiE
LNGANTVQPYTPHFLLNQAHRTAPTRQYLYSLANWTKAPLSLDLGCGTGHITTELASTVPYAHAIGLDIDLELLSNAQESNSGNARLHWLLSDATALPLRRSLFSFVISHFTLMWIPEHQRAVAEVFRVLRSQTLFTAIEPDYSGRIEGPTKTRKKPHYPIIDWLISKGANPFLGGKLPSELHNAGFSHVAYGVLAWEYHADTAEAEVQSEANLLRAEGIHWEQPLFTYTPIFWIKAKKA